jgi:hypothetical protein
MAREKLFYKYQSLEVAVDDDDKVIKDGNGNNGNNVIYDIKNLANNQLFFKNPNKFNDPFDSRICCFYPGAYPPYP